MPAINPFNPDDVKDDDFLCPAGEGIAEIVGSKLREVEGKGLLLNIEYAFKDGPLAGRHAFEGFFIEHFNPQVVEIAQRSLKKLCAAVGHQGVLRDTDDLHFKPLRLKVVVKPDKEGTDRNRFSYSALGSGAGATASAAPAKTPWGVR